MKYTFACKRVPLNDSIKEYAQKKISKLERYFREEDREHILEKRCPAGVWKALIQYLVDPSKCKGCTRCARGCPTGAISGAVRAPHIINQSKCIKCGACMDHCRFDAIYKQ